MICAIVGAFLLVYVEVITFMNILGYPMKEFMFTENKNMLSLKKIHTLSLLCQLLAMFMLLEEGHVITLPLPHVIVQLICIIFAICLSYITIKNFQSPYQEKKYFMIPLLLTIILCFWTTLFNA